MASETNGTWQPAEEAPGTAALNRGGTAYIESVSCASAGNCSAGGSYTDSSGHQQAFVASETSGTWQPAEEAPGTAVLNHGGTAVIESVSCPSAGNCSAGGDYLDGSSAQAFVVSEVGGRWQQADEVPGTAVLNQGGAAVTESVSCASAGNCTAGGDYLDGSSAQQVFVVSETGGRWQQAEQIPGTAVLNTGRKAGINSLSCASAGNCSAGGSYASGPYGHPRFCGRRVQPPVATGRGDSGRSRPRHGPAGRCLLGVLRDEGLLQRGRTIRWRSVDLPGVRRQQELCIVLLTG